MNTKNTTKRNAILAALDAFARTCQSEWSAKESLDWQDVEDLVSMARDARPVAGPALSAAIEEILSECEVENWDSGIVANFPNMIMSAIEADRPEGFLRVGDRVRVTVEGLQKHARSVPAHMGYTSAQFEFRRELSDLCDRGVVGTVKRVFESGTLNVEFEGTLYGVQPSMLKRVE